MKEADEAARGMLVRTLGAAPTHRPGIVATAHPGVPRRHSCIPEVHTPLRLQNLTQGLKAPLPWTPDKMVALRDAVACSQGRAGVHLVWQHHMDKVAVRRRLAPCRVQPAAQCQICDVWHCG